MKRLISGAAVLLSLAACDPGTSFVFASANVASVVDTEKTLVDHAASWITGEDCSTVEALDGRSYCSEEELALAPAAGGGEHYCYRSIGSIICYRAPDPQASDAMRVQ